MQIWVFFLAILIVTIIVAIRTRYREDMRLIKERIASFEPQIIHTPGGPVEYAASGQGYPVLTVHGAIGGFDQGLFLAHNIEASNVHIISVSRFGYLGTPIPIGAPTGMGEPIPPAADLNAQADAFAQLLDGLGISQAAVFAVSSGTTSAIRFAARHPRRVSAMILFCPDAPGEGYMSLPPRFVFDKLMRNDFLNWFMMNYFGKQMQKMMGLAPKGFAMTPEYQSLADMVLVSNLPASRRMDGMIFETYTLDAELKASVTPESPYPLKDIQPPMLVINALDDPISLPQNVKRLAEQLPNARRFTVPDGGHLLFGHAEEVRGEITRFLREYVPELRK